MVEGGLRKRPGPLPARPALVQVPGALARFFRSFAVGGKYYLGTGMGIGESLMMIEFDSQMAADIRKLGRIDAELLARHLH